MVRRNESDHEADGQNHLPGLVRLEHRDRVALTVHRGSSRQFVDLHSCRQPSLGDKVLAVAHAPASSWQLRGIYHFEAEGALAFGYLRRIIDERETSVIGRQWVRTVDVLE